jgi:hypothetical protein
MATSRRSFLKSGTMGLLFAGVPAVLRKIVSGRTLGAGGFPERNAAGETRFTMGTFARHLNTTFRIKGSSGTVDLKLAKVTDLKATSKTPARIAGSESFSLLFVGSRKATSLTQDTYRVQHEALGRFSLFLVPVGKPANRRFEAIFIRL